jgi:nitrate/nitrite transporter NarK
MAIPGLYVLGVILAYGGSWGVNGILFMAVVRHSPHAPAAVSGQVIAVGSIGGFLGPPAFGFVAEQWGYGAAWIMTAFWVAVAAACTVRSRAARAAASQAGT